jgi:hypothetical protein
MIAEIAKIVHKIRQIRSICGTFSATDFGKSLSVVPDPSSGTTVPMSSGFTIAVDKKSKINAPNPNPPIISPETSPLFSGNHSHPH